MSSAFSHDSRLLATGDRRGAIKIWEIATGRQFLSLPATDSRINALEFSPDGQSLASSMGLFPSEVRVWNLASPTRPQAVISVSGQVEHLAFSPDGAWLATAGENVKVWSTANGAQVGEMEVSSPTQVSLAFSPDGKILAVREPARLRLWTVNAQDQAVRQIELGNYSGRHAVMFQPDGTLIVTGERDLVQTWNVATGKLVASAKMDQQFQLSSCHSAGECAIRQQKCGYDVWNVTRPSRVRTLVEKAKCSGMLSPDWRWLAVPSEPDASSVTLTNLASGGTPVVLSGRVAPAGATAFSPDGSHLATTSGKRVWVWDLRAGKPRTLDGHEGEWGEIQVETVGFIAKGRTLISADWTGKIVQTDLASGRIEDSIEMATEGSTRGHALSVDGRWMVSAEQGKISVLELPGCQVRRTLQNTHRGIAISPDGQFLAAATAAFLRPVFPRPPESPQAVDLWDLRTGTHRTFSGHTRPLTRVAFAPDGKVLASSDLGGAVRLWEAQTGRALQTFQAPNSARVWSLTFHPGGEILAAGSSDSAILLWDLRTGELRRTLTGHTDIPGKLSFSPDGGLLASATDNGDTRLWDVERGVELVMLIAMKDANEWLAVTPEGHFDGSEIARKTLIAWRVGSSVVPSERFWERYYTPGLLARIFAVKTDQKRQEGRKAAPGK